MKQSIGEKYLIPVSVTLKKKLKQSKILQNALAPTGSINLGKCEIVHLSTVLKSRNSENAPFKLKKYNHHYQPFTKLL